MLIVSWLSNLDFENITWLKYCSFSTLWRFCTMVISANLKYSKTNEEHFKCWKLHHTCMRRFTYVNLTTTSKVFYFMTNLNINCWMSIEALKTTSKIQSTQFFKLSLGDKMHSLPHPNLSKWRYPLCPSATSMKIHHTIWNYPQLHE